MKTENPVIWFEIYVDDLERAQKFYEQVFQMQLSELGDPTKDGMQMLAFPSDMESKNKATGALVFMKEMKAGENSTVVYFASEDCSIEESRAKKAGGAVFRPKMSIGEYGFISLLKDSENNIIGVHSMQ